MGQVARRFSHLARKIMSLAEPVARRLFKSSMTVANGH